MSEHAAPVAPSRHAYIYYRCRCEDCRLANRTYQREANARRSYLLDMDEADVAHGTVSTYRNWGCRCAPCTAANTESCHAYAENRRAAPP